MIKLVLKQARFKVDLLKFLYYILQDRKVHTRLRLEKRDVLLKDRFYEDFGSAEKNSEAAIWFHLA